MKYAKDDYVGSSKKLSDAVQTVLSKHIMGRHQNMNVLEVQREFVEVL